MLTRPLGASQFPVSTFNNQIYDPTKQQWVSAGGNIFGGDLGASSPLNVPPLGSNTPAKPQAMDKTGLLRQFGYGFVSPVTDTLAKFGWMEKRPQPVTSGESVAKSVGALIAMAAILSPLLLTPAIGGLIALGAKAAGATALASTASSASTAGVLAIGSKVGLLGKTAGTAALAARGAAATNLAFQAAMGAGTGVAYGAHQAWVNDEEYTLRQAAVQAVTGGIFGGVTGKLAQYLQSKTILKSAERGVGHLRNIVPGQQADFFNMKPQQISAYLRGVPEERLASVVDDVLLGVDPTNLPQSMRTDPIKGLYMVNQKYAWDKLTTVQKANALIRAYKTDPSQHNVLQPLFNLSKDSELVYGVNNLLNSDTPGVASDITDVMRTAPKVDVTSTYAVTPEHAKLLKRGSTIYDQVNNAQIVAKQARERWGEVIDGTNNMIKMLTNKNIKINDVRELSKLRGLLPNDKAYDSVTDHILKEWNLYNNTLNFRQEIMWKANESLASIDKFQLISPRHVTDVVTGKKFLQSLSDDTEVESIFHKDIMRFMRKVYSRPENRAAVEKFEGNPYTFEALRKLAPKEVTNFKNIVSGLKAKGESVRGFWIGSHGFEFDDDILEFGYQKIKSVADIDIDKLARSPFTLSDARVLEGQGLTWLEKMFPIRGAFGKPMASSLREATNQRSDFLERFLGPKGLKEWDGWLADIGIKQQKDVNVAGEIVGGLLENTDDAVRKAVKNASRYKLGNKTLINTAKKLGVKPEELKIAGEMRKAYNVLFDEMGIPYDKFIDAYMPHIAKTGKTVMTEDSFVNLLKASGFDEQTIRSIRFVHELDRTGGLVVYEKNAFKAFNRYVSGASKKKFYEPWIKHWDKEVFRGGHASESKRALYNDLKRTLMGIPSPIEKSVDDMVTGIASLFGKELAGTRPTAQASAFLAELQYTGAMGYNPFSAVKNLTQKVLSVAELSEDGNLLTGVQNFYRYKASGFRQVADKLNPVLKHRAFLEGLEMSDSAFVGPARRLGIDPRRINHITKGAFDWFRKADRSNVSDAFGAKLFFALEKGAPMMDAIEIATQATMNTQYMYGIDSPLLYKTPLGRQLGIFMSWPLNWAMQLAESGKEGDLRVAFATVLGMAASAEVLTATGIDFMSTHPISVARNILPIALSEGEERWPLPTRIAGSTWEWARAVSRGDPVAVDEAAQNFMQTARVLLPFSTQATRMVNFIGLARNEWKSIDKKGRLRADLTMDEHDFWLDTVGVPGEAMRGLLGRTTEASKRYEDWSQLQNLESHYRSMRSKAIQAYYSGNKKQFERLQELLYSQYGTYIKPEDIEREYQLRTSSAVVRQLQGLPKSFTEPYLLSRGLPID